MTANRIICIGNRYCEHDNAGLRVHDRLVEQGVPPGIEVFDGGLAGPNLLLLVESTEKVVFVDQVSGFGTEGEVMTLGTDELCDNADSRLSHGGGLPYLLKTMEASHPASPPKVLVVGIEGPADEAAIDKAAGLALDLAGEPEGHL